MTTMVIKPGKHVIQPQQHHHNIHGWHGHCLKGNQWWEVVPRFKKNAHMVCNMLKDVIELDDGKIYRKAPYLMGKSMVSCKISLKPIQSGCLFINCMFFLFFHWIPGWDFGGKCFKPPSKRFFQGSPEGIETLRSAESITTTPQLHGPKTVQITLKKLWLSEERWIRIIRRREFFGLTNHPTIILYHSISIYFPCCWWWNHFKLHLYND